MGSLPEGKSQGLCLVQLCANYTVQASEHYVESLPLVLKDIRSCFSQDERFTVQHLLIACLPSGSRALN